jgi:acetylornithine deacetylase/succinyl-diaminopimelate desuccinylase-like protein
MKDIGLEKGYGESGFSTLERRWARPSCDINGIYGGYMGPGAKTVIPSFAGAKVSFRLAANQSAAKVAEQFRGWLQSQDVHGCRWEITDLHGADPVITPTESPWIAAASRAVKRTSGKEAMLVREGATIPVCIDFKRVLNLDSVLIGFGLSDDCIHSPNEKFNLECFELGKRTHAALLAELATAPAEA